MPIEEEEIKPVKINGLTLNKKRKRDESASSSEEKKKKKKKDKKHKKEKKEKKSKKDKADKRAKRSDSADDERPERWVPPTENPWTGLQWSQTYHDILEKRRELPAWQARKQVVDLVTEYQVMILQGETGSGKTT